MPNGGERKSEDALDHRRAQVGEHEAPALRTDFTVAKSGTFSTSRNAPVQENSSNRTASGSSFAPKQSNNISDDKNRTINKENSLWKEPIQSFRKPSYDEDRKKLNVYNSDLDICYKLLSKFSEHKLVGSYPQSSHLDQGGSRCGKERKYQTDDCSAQRDREVD